PPAGAEVLPGSSGPTKDSPLFPSRAMPMAGWILIVVIAISPPSVFADQGQKAGATHARLVGAPLPWVNHISPKVDSVNAPCVSSGKIGLSVRGADPDRRAPSRRVAGVRRTHTAAQAEAHAAELEEWHRRAEEACEPRHRVLVH